eukprot:2326550-Alexandrium_andersonii.AAC.1
MLAAPGGADEESRACACIAQHHACSTGVMLTRNARANSATIPRQRAPPQAMLTRKRVRAPTQRSPRVQHGSNAEEGLRCQRAWHVVALR